jgi:hypothetical protein
LVEWLLWIPPTLVFPDVDHNASGRAPKHSPDTDTDIIVFRTSDFLFFTITTLVPRSTLSLFTTLRPQHHQYQKSMFCS